MITTVTLNPAIDKTLTIEQFEINKVNRVSSISEGLGGKGLNVSKVLNYLKTENRAIGFIGERNYTRIQHLNKDYPIEMDFVLVDANTRTNTKIIDPYHQNTTDINEAGFEVTSTHISQMKKLISTYSLISEFMIFSGSVCKGIDQDTYLDLLKTVKETCKLVIDIDGEMLKVSLKASPFLIKPNIDELEKLVNKTLATKEEIVTECRKLINEYHISYILVSCGEKGSLLVSENICLEANALKVEVVSTVGAGDSMLAAFIAKYSQTKDINSSLQYGACAGSLAVCDISTDIFKTKHIEDYLNQIQIQTI